jgi:hypothetical protein
VGVKAVRWDQHPIVDGPGIYLGVPMEVYRADPCPAPSLNASVAWDCLRKSLAHAAAAHPKIEPPELEDEGEEEDAPANKRHIDIGSAAHALAFGVGQEICLIHAKNWKKKAEQEARKAAYDAGEIPLLPKEYRRAKTMAAIAKPIIDGLLEGSLVAEAMIVWRDEQGFWYRGLIDRMRADARVIVDYKTTTQVQSPEQAMGLVYSSKAYFQEGFYRWGLDTLDPEGAGRRRFWFLYQEQEPPHCPCLIETSEAGRSLADEQVQGAVNVWKRGLVTGAWPGWDLGPHIASPPSWLLTQWEQRALYDETLNPMEMA